MKKEWIYFIAGAGLMGAVMSFTIASKHMVVRVLFIFGLSLLASCSATPLSSELVLDRGGESKEVRIDSEEKICKEETVPGSRLKQRVCRSQRELDALQARAKEAYRKSRETICCIK
tara:strand:+ start:244 stop:594 length:351 start_codon:yes stop_codon:yes gene_type:complete